MKALKEKRISLRSLWRRGLVILSLFALVFASCSDSGGEAGSGDIVDKMELVWTDVPMQYQGRPVDLKGAQVKITYTNGKTETVTNTNLITTVPRLIIGRYDTATSAFVPQRTYQISCKGYYFTNYPFAAGKIQQIVRGDYYYGPDWEITQPTQEPLVLRDNGIYTWGIGTADTKLNNSKVFADTEKFDFSGLKMYAQYTDGEKLPIDLEKDVLWKVFPDYFDKNDDDTYKGAVYIMVGADVDDYYADVPGLYRFGVTHREPLDVVYTVTDISYTKERDIAPFFFWEQNTPQSWARRLADAGVSLKINYTGGKSDTKNIADMIAKEDIWYNFNPGYSTSDLFITPLSYPFKADKKDPDKGYIKVYYRGAKKDSAGEYVRIQIPVFTKLVNISVEGPDGDIGLDAEIVDTEVLARDNDIGADVYGSTETDLTKLLTVKATYQAFNTVDGATVTQELTLKPAETRIAWGATIPGVTYPNGGTRQADVGAVGNGSTSPTQNTGTYNGATPNYPGFTGFTSSYNNVTGTWSFTYPAAARGRQAWGEYYVTNFDYIRNDMLANGKNGKVKAVTVRYEVAPAEVLRHLGEAAIDQKYSYIYELKTGLNPDFNVLFDGVTVLPSTSAASTPTELGVTATQTKSKKVNVKWSKQP